MPAEVARLEGAAAELGGRVLWSDLTLSLAAGEFLAVVGPNGAGKTSLLRALLGLLPLRAGRVSITGAPARRGHPAIGYVPQNRAFDPAVPLRGRDLVAMGTGAWRWGPWPRPGRLVRAAVDRALGAVGATALAEAPLGRLSGGEQQRLRIACALAGEPRLLLFDEPLASLDPGSQQTVAQWLANLTRTAALAVVCVTHDINALAPRASRVLALGGGRWALGPPGEVLRPETLRRLYGGTIDVLEHRGRIVILGQQPAPIAPDRCGL